MSQIYHNIWIGDYEGAHDHQWLKRNGVTHIQTCATEGNPKFPKQFQYKIIPIMMQETFDIQPFLDTAADFILKACEEGIIYMHGYKEESRAAACLTAFLMKFFGWDYLTCLKTISKKRSIIKLTKKHKFAVFQYCEELNRLKECIDNGEEGKSDLISNFQSSMKPFFLRKKNNMKKGVPHAYAYAGNREETEDERLPTEVLGGDNCSPRNADSIKKSNQSNMSKSVSNMNFRSKEYMGTDQYVKARINGPGSSQGTPLMSRTNSLVRMHRKQSSEDIINACGYPGRPNFNNSRKTMHADEENPLTPQKGLESDIQSVASSTKAQSMQSQRNRYRREIKHSIEATLNASKPRWMSKAIQDRNTQFQLAPMKGPEARYYKKNGRKDPIYFENGHDKMNPLDYIYNVPAEKPKDFYFADKPVGRRFFTYVNNQEHARMPRLETALEKKVRYTSTCCWVKGKSAFETSQENLIPKFGKTSTIFNYKNKPSFLDQNGNSNLDWGNIAMGKLPGGKLLCGFCQHVLCEQKDIIPHSYKKPIIDIRGNMSYVDTYVNPDSGKGQSGCNNFSKDYTQVEDFYACTGVFTKMMPYMRFDTSSNGGQIICPKCSKHVGQAKLSGIKCGCSFFAVPGYQLWKSRVIVKAR